MGIRGMMNKDKNIYVDHIIEANTKFLDLLQKLAQEKISLDDRLMRTMDKAQKLRILRDLQRSRNDKAGQKYKETDDKMRQALKE